MVRVVSRLDVREWLLQSGYYHEAPRRARRGWAGIMTTQRKEVKRFAARMEEVLQENDHKSHWSKCSYAYLLQRLKQEVDELDEAIAGHVIGQVMPRDLSGASSVEQYGEVEKEAVDVANFAMMIADNLRNLKENDEDYRYFTERVIRR